jgi:dephospho-CoA kinase
MKTVIGLVGSIGAGKDTVARHLEASYGATRLQVPDLLKSISAILGITVDRKGLQQLAMCLSKHLGPEVLPRAVLAAAPPHANPLVYDGFRFVGQVDYMRRLEEVRFVLVAIELDIETRYKRVRDRAQYLDEVDLDFNGFAAGHANPVEVEVPTIMRHADFTIVNDGSRHDLRRRVDGIALKILG